jgi:hypothetical protein
VSAKSSTKKGFVENTNVCSQKLNFSQSIFYFSNICILFNYCMYINTLADQAAINMDQ